MSEISIKCHICDIEFKKSKKEYTRQINKGYSNFYCSKECRIVQLKKDKTKYFSITIPCISCGINFKSSTKPKSKKCCSKICASKYSYKFVNPEKISESLKKIYPKKIKFCKHCNVNEVLCRSKFCSNRCKTDFSRKDLSEYSKYKLNCKFNFPLKDYPNEFDFSLIEKYGWYKAKNRGNNLGGVSRDHIISVKYGFENNIDPKLISHPANCRLMIHNDNVSKGKKLTTSIEKIKQKIIEWDKKYKERIEILDL